MHYIPISMSLWEASFIASKHFVRLERYFRAIPEPSMQKSLLELLASFLYRLLDIL